MRTLAAAMCLPTFLLWSAGSSAQALIEDYARVAALVSYMKTFVGETLLACVEVRALPEAEAEPRFAAYQKRNAALFERAERWSKGAEGRLGGSGEGRDAQVLAEDASFTAMAAASARARGELGAASDPAAFCAARLAAIQDGSFDASRNGELAKLLHR